MFVCCECCVLSGRGLCDELITRLEECYRMWCVVVCDLETSSMRRPWPALGRSATPKKNPRSKETTSRLLKSFSWSCIWRKLPLFYAFFWVIPRRLDFICRRFGTLCLFHLHRRVGVEWNRQGVPKRLKFRELPRIRHKTFRTRRTFEIKN
jgi:hypothetical protein